MQADGLVQMQETVLHESANCPTQPDRVSKSQVSVGDHGETVRTVHATELCIISGVQPAKISEMNLVHNLEDVIGGGSVGGNEDTSKSGSKSVARSGTGHSISPGTRASRVKLNKDLEKKQSEMNKQNAAQSSKSIVAQNMISDMREVSAARVLYSNNKEASSNTSGTLLQKSSPEKVPSSTPRNNLPSLPYQGNYDASPSKGQPTVKKVIEAENSASKKLPL